MMKDRQTKGEREREIGKNLQKHRLREREKKRRETKTKSE
jgi:hypothetical protein